MTIKVTLTAEQHQHPERVAVAHIMMRDKYDWVQSGHPVVLSQSPVDLYVYDGQKLIISEKS